jgi:hypothetical protein
MWPGPQQKCWRTPARSASASKHEGQTVVGSLKKATGGTVGDRWSWSITCVRIDPGARIGWALIRVGKLAIS